MGEINFKHALSTPQAAEFLHLSPATLERWRWQRYRTKSSPGPDFYQIGGRIFYLRADLVRFAERGLCMAEPIDTPEISA
jgi:hypothetical protein